MVYLPLENRWEWWCTIHRYSLRSLLWWPIKYLCSLKTHRYQSWTAELQWKYISLYDHYNYARNCNSQLHRKCWSLIWSRRNLDKTLNCLLSKLVCIACFSKYSFYLFYIYKIVCLQLKRLPCFIIRLYQNCREK